MLEMLPDDKMYHVLVEDDEGETYVEYFGNTFRERNGIFFVGDSDDFSHGYHFNLPMGYDVEVGIVDRDERYDGNRKVK